MWIMTGNKNPLDDNSKNRIIKRMKIEEGDA